MRLRYRHRFLLVSLLLLLTTIGIFLVFRQHVNAIDHWLISVGWWGPVLAILLYTILSLTPIPTDPITVMLGALYGPYLGLAISWVGNTSAALLEYFLAHHLGNLGRFDRLRQKLPWGLNTAPVDSVWFLTLGRAAPGYGSKVVSILSGLYHVPLRRYLWTTALMNVLGSLGYVLGGHLLLRW